MPSLELAAGQVLTAAHTNTYWMRQVVATGLSSARPTGYEGRAVYDTDTDALMVYASATTGWRPPWNLPWGYIGGVAVTSGVATQSANTMADAAGVTVTFSAVAGRRYRARLHAPVNTSGGNTTVQAQLLVDGTRVGIANAQGVATGYETITIDVPVTGLTTGSHTLKMQWASAAAVAINPAYASDAPWSLTIEDIGPTSAPA